VLGAEQARRLLAPIIIHHPPSYSQNQHQPTHHQNQKKNNHNQNNQNSVSLERLYVAGEGAGYAGGIVSAAVDGLRVGAAAARALAGLELPLKF
jgi:CubicO group peptidase (beta-lactamase class C family)